MEVWVEPAVPADLYRRTAGDPFCRLLGIRLEALQPRHARLTMRVREDMLNFHGSGHGGALFALADAAHAAASNSHGVPAVALHVALHDLAPARPGDELGPRPGRKAGAAGPPSTGWRCGSGPAAG